jgi:hypothetical protein
MLAAKGITDAPPKAVRDLFGAVQSSLCGWTAFSSSSQFVDAQFRPQPISLTQAAVLFRDPLRAPLSESLVARL